eukprot:TRINITY_DN32303_c0_g1_i1.p2 TRINITY_DN32303_c0_g1~~TRINITY_DN32303_c0_g1_i1.p2  ORF type:complete len:125 (-),score=29.40 TRINITY_DN32303_c0_g1_i1:2-376(-)
MSSGKLKRSTDTDSPAESPSHESVSDVAEEPPATGEVISARRSRKTVRWVPGLKDTQRGPLKSRHEMEIASARQAEEDSFHERVAAQMLKIAEIANDNDAEVMRQRELRRERTNAIKSAHSMPL